ncbi:MAG: P1 family peptidase [Acidobacteria bacterium]|nr:P1 family peptidase [Acidobacteriota bacterium]
MRITVAFNLRTDASEESAELLTQEDVDRICGALRELRHHVSPVEVSGQPGEVVTRLLDSAPELIFNCAEGTIGSSREAFYPGLYEQLRIPFTGGNPSLLHMNLDKHLAKTVVAARGVRVPKGGLVTPENREPPADLRYPVIIKPNAEGSSKGITQDSVVETREHCETRVEQLLGRYPAGLVVEEFIAGRELSVPILDAFPGKILEIVEHTFDLESIGGRYNVYDYDMKQGGERAKGVGVVCPAELEPAERETVVEMARRVFEIMHCPDLGRVDIRLDEDGLPYFIELNPLPSLHPVASLMIAGRERGLEYRDVLRLVVRSAARRYKLAARPPRKVPGEEAARPTARDLGIRVGRFPTGVNNAITDVKGVRVGHLTRTEDAAPVPGSSETARVRTGVTAIVPGEGDVFRRRVVAGGFVLNGVGEMAGLTQALEWGYIETPILLTNSLSVGRALQGVISHMVKKHPEIGTLEDPVLPVVGEADDSFLNDTRVGLCTAQDAQRALEAAKGGPVAQGSVGAGTGMMTFDFAGGIGTSSRSIEVEGRAFIVGVLVMSNCGNMRNLTIDGRVVGRELDAQMATAGRRARSYGSVITVVATDVPLLSSQLSRVAKRAALGLGRVGSHAASTSGEIVVAFSTSNRVPRSSSQPSKFRTLKFVADTHINSLYEAVIEATEEAVLNAIFCSAGVAGREGREAPAIPQDAVLELLRNNGENHAGR